MNKILQIPEVKIVYHYGHFSFYMRCPDCNEAFEFHCDYFPNELCCPYCRISYDLKNPHKSHQLTA